MKVSRNKRRSAHRPLAHSTKHARHSEIEAVELRLLLTTGTVTVNATQTVRTIPADYVGVNIAEWDGELTNTTTQQDTEAAGLGFIRMPGGSTADAWQWTSASNTMSVSQMAQFVQTVGGIGMQTIDYGEGSPQEGAALYAYYNASPSNTTVIGYGQQWNGSEWVQVNWQTAGYWASLRAASPISGNSDGLNNLRASRPASYNVNYWEVGNEEYGSWETDEHGQTGDTSLNGGPGAQHDPLTYVTFASQFAALVNQINSGDAAVGQTDAPHYIGVDASGASPTDPESGQFYSWIVNVLADCNTLGFVPSFISDHSYMQDGNENDTTLLTNTVTAPATVNGKANGNADENWSIRAANFRTLLNTYSWGPSVELLNTEYGSEAGTPNKQSTSLVNGLFVADSIGSILQTEYNGTIYWDLQNSYATATNQSGLYGWRTGGDFGIIGSGNTTKLPSTGLNVPYPTYFALQLVSEIDQTGNTVVSTTSDNSLLDAYGIMQSSDGDLDILVIDKSSSASFTETFNVPGFLPSGQAEIWQYGETQDTAQSQSKTGASALANSSTNFTITNTGGTASFSDTFPQYSMTVIQLTPDTAPIVNVAATGTLTVPGTGVALAVGATGGTGASTLIYTWSTLSSPIGIASPTFSLNGTNAAADDNATVFGPGVYVFSVAVSDVNGLGTATSTFAIVSQVPGAVIVSPSNISLSADSTYRFSATALDQFGNPLAQQSFNWSVTGSNNSISNSGLLSLNSPSGTSMVTAADGSINGSATVMTLGSSPGGGGLDVTSTPTNPVSPITTSPVTISPVKVSPIKLLPITTVTKAPGYVLTLNPAPTNTTVVSPFADPTSSSSSLLNSPGSLFFGTGSPSVGISGKPRWITGYQIGPLRIS